MRKLRSFWWWGGGIGVVAVATGAVMTMNPTYAATPTAPHVPHTISVLGTATQTNGQSTPNITVNLNLNPSASKNPVTAWHTLQTTAQGIKTALEKVGIAAAQIQIANQSLSSSPASAMASSAASPSSSPMQPAYPDQSNETIQIHGVPSQEAAILKIIASQLATGFSGQDNLYISQVTNSSANAHAAVMQQAMQAAHTEALAVAAKMGVGLGSVAKVTQIDYQGPSGKSNQYDVQLRVSYRIR